MAYSELESKWLSSFLNHFPDSEVVTALLDDVPPGLGAMRSDSG